MGLKVKFITLGCKVNQYESQAMLEALEKVGFRQAEGPEKADIVVLNSCTVTAASDQKARQALRRAKKQNPGAIAVLTGCWPQAFPKEAQNFLEADIVLGVKNRTSLASYLLDYLSKKQRMVDIPPHKSGDAFEPLQVSDFHGRTRAFLKIEDGCNRFCSYCIIPYARGRVRSKPLADITAELTTLAARGYQEAVLTGINLPAYGQDLGLQLCDAIEAACKVEGIRRVRLGSLEPEQFSAEVISRMRAQEKLCPQFHLSLQSGCDGTLSRMNRHYTTGEYRQIVAALRKAFPNCAITTDVMVGFAGETEEEFQQSLAFVQEMAFAKVHVFAYSRRPGTKAYSAPNQCTNREKEERSHKMLTAAKALQSAFFRAQLGKVEEVLFEQKKQGDFYEGYTKNYIPILAASRKPLQGKILPVRLTQVQEEYCLGEVCEIC